MGWIFTGITLAALIVWLTTYGTPRYSVRTDVPLLSRKAVSLLLLTTAIFVVLWWQYHYIQEAFLQLGNWLYLEHAVVLVVGLGIALWLGLNGHKKYVWWVLAATGVVIGLLVLSQGHTLTSVTLPNLEVEQKATDLQQVFQADPKLVWYVLVPLGVGFFAFFFSKSSNNRATKAVVAAFLAGIGTVLWFNPELVQSFVGPIDQRSHEMISDSNVGKLVTLAMLGLLVTGLLTGYIIEVLAIILVLYISRSFLGV